jgi:SAM-dependent methyltransferase
VRDQTDIFSADEGDRWFRRNQARLDGGQGDDRVMAMLSRWNECEQVGSVCELGCANGWRLASIGERFPHVERLAGSDVSAEAIADGRRRWTTLELAVGSLDRTAIHGLFDVVIVSFVFHWVARARLASSIAAVDALVADGGALILSDFLPDNPCARPYHHRTDVELFTYKQDYVRCFTDLEIYGELERAVFSHGGGARPIDEQDRAICVLLRKDLSGRGTEA